MKKLAEVLTIIRGEVKPRHDWREVKRQELRGQTPMLNILHYHLLCNDLNKAPSANEWANIYFQMNDEGPGAA
jgi:hypothetical protein